MKPENTLKNTNKCDLLLNKAVCGKAEEDYDALFLELESECVYFDPGAGASASMATSSAPAGSGTKVIVFLLREDRRLPQKFAGMKWVDLLRIVNGDSDLAGIVIQGSDNWIFVPKKVSLALYERALAAVEVSEVNVYRDGGTVEFVIKNHERIYNVLARVPSQGRRKIYIDSVLAGEDGLKKLLTDLGIWMESLQKDDLALIDKIISDGVVNVSESVDRKLIAASHVMKVLNYIKCI